jgi:hypothetical protein
MCRRENHPVQVRGIRVSRFGALSVALYDSFSGRNSSSFVLFEAIELRAESPRPVASAAPRSAVQMFGSFAASSDQISSIVRFNNYGKATFTCQFIAF